MKYTTESEFKGLLKNFFLQKIESVDRAVRGEEEDYPEENEGPGTTYEHLKFETNLYTDSSVDKVSGKEDIAHGKDIEKDTYDKELDEVAEEDDEKEDDLDEGCEEEKHEKEDDKKNEVRFPSLRSLFESGDFLGTNKKK